MKNMNPSSLAGKQRRKLDDVFIKTEKVYNNDVKELVILGKRIEDESEDEDIDENDKKLHRLISIEEELQDLRINQ